jgi:DMSO/TMAO reductase YedYZ molybdopterin-dependent catalytic subunit
VEVNIVKRNKSILRVTIVIVIVLAALLSSCQQTVSSSTPTASSTNTTPTSSHTATVTPPPGQDITEANISTYRLIIDGLVVNPLSLTYASLIQYPEVTEKVWLVCPGSFSEDREWTGVSLPTLLAKAGLKPGASQVTFYASVASGGYKKSVPLADTQQEGVFLAYRVNGGIISSTDGYPLRLVIKPRDGSFWVKWLDHIEVS